MRRVPCAVDRRAVPEAGAVSGRARGVVPGPGKGAPRREGLLERHRELRGGGDPLAPGPGPATPPGEGLLSERRARERGAHLPVAPPGRRGPAGRGGDVGGGSLQVLRGLRARARVGGPGATRSAAAATDGRLPEPP